MQTLGTSSKRYGETPRSVHSAHQGDMGPMNALLDAQDQARKKARIESMQSYRADRSPEGIVVGGRAPLCIDGSRCDNSRGISFESKYR
jgi:hypothetical protein